MIASTFLLGAASLPLAFAASGTFNVLSMNVAGLPAILNNNGITNKTGAANDIGITMSHYS